MRDNDHLKRTGFRRDNVKRVEAGTKSKRRLEEQLTASLKRGRSNIGRLGGQMEVLNGEDIINMAIYMEDDGRDFYLQVAERFKADASVADLFTFMAEEEAEHRETFKRMVNEVRAGNRLLEQDYPGEYRQYLQAYMQSHGIGAKKDLKKRLDRLENIIEATEIAVELENDSIVFYNSLRPLLPLVMHPLIVRIVKEEYQHITRIYEYRRALLRVL